MIIPSDAILHTAEILTLRHLAPTTYRQVIRLYTAYLRGVDRLPRRGTVDAQYLVRELDRGRVTALAINCDRYLRLVGLATGGVIEYPETLLVCTDLELVSHKWRSDQRLGAARRELLRQACLRYVTDYRLIYDLSERHRIRRRILWRSPCGGQFTDYRLRGTRLVRS